MEINERYKEEINKLKKKIKKILKNQRKRIK